ncbi:YHYH protein (plasmid) [Coraliomargarita sp. W4R53]
MLVQRPLIQTGALVSAALVTALVLSACAAEPNTAQNPPADIGATPEASETEPLVETMLWSAVVDPTAIPMGDGMISIEPTVGSLMSCQTEFGGRGAAHDGPWIDQENGTWDATTKVQVEGSNTWPQAFYSEVIEGDARHITGSNLPVDDVTGNFPIAESDPSYQYDRNPNEIDEKVIDLLLPFRPTDASQPECVPMGVIAVLKNGVYLFNSLDAAGKDAAAHETQDVCDGHPDGGDFYHFHNIPSCLLDAAGSTDEGVAVANTSTLVGYALDGYGIYVERDSKGNLPTNADLDECHGRTSVVTFDGEEQEIYHYSATLEFPYTVGCFHGTPVEQPSHAH